MDVVSNTYRLFNQTSEGIEKLTLNVLSPHKLNCNEYAILECLSKKGPHTINQLVDEIKVSSGSMTYLIDQLEAKELIKRIKSPTDRRSYSVHLTENGEDLVDIVLPKYQVEIEKVFACFTPDEIETTFTLINKLNQNMQSI